MSTHVFFVRHQAHGVLYDMPFAAPPTAEQLSRIEALMRTRYGDTSMVTDEPYWMRVVSYPFVDGSVAELNESAPGAGGDVTLQAHVVRGGATVSASTKPEG